MTEPTETTEQPNGSEPPPAVMQPLPPREVRVVADAEPILDTAKFEHMQRIAMVMARCSLIPDSLRDKDDYKVTEANCFLIVNQSVRWKMDPFAVAQCASVIHGKLCYEGKLVSAVMQNSGINLSYKIEGDGDNMRVTVTGTLPGEREKREVVGTVVQWRTVNDNWRKDPRSMLCYRGARQWARIHNPAPMLGVYTPDEIEIDDNVKQIAPVETPPDPPRTKAAEPAKVETPPDPPAVSAVGVAAGSTEIKNVKAEVTEAPTTQKSKRTRKPRESATSVADKVTVMDEADWLKQLDAALAGCCDVMQIFEKQTELMQPHKKTVKEESWKAAQAIVATHVRRVEQESTKDKAPEVQPHG